MRTGEGTGMSLRSILSFATALLVITIGSSCSTSVEHEMLTFGPPEAENEIRNIFGITGEDVMIDHLYRVADSTDIVHEPLVHDRSLVHCDRGRDTDSLRLEIFYARLDDRQGAAFNYVVVYNEERRVVCIETRHAYRAHMRLQRQ